MTTSGTKKSVWHNDGHRVIILIGPEDKVAITLEYCPNGGKPETDCWHREADGCLVKYFIGLYGLEANRGMAPASLFTDISWVFEEGYELYTSFFKFAPVEDEAFAAWVEEQMKLYGEEE